MIDLNDPSQDPVPTGGLTPGTDWFAQNGPSGTSNTNQTPLPTDPNASNPTGPPAYSGFDKTWFGNTFGKGFEDVSTNQQKQALAMAFQRGLKGQSAVDWINKNYPSLSGTYKYYPENDTYGAPDFYVSPVSGNPSQYELTVRGTGGATGGTLDQGGQTGDFVAPYDKNFSQFYKSDFFLPRTTSPFALPSGQDVLNQDPGYGFRLDQGRQSIEQSAAARGLLNSGGTLKDILGYGQSLGSQEYANAVGRAKDTWMMNAGNDQNYNDWAWNQFMRSQDQYTGQQDRAFDKFYKTTTLGANAATA